MITWQMLSGLLGICAILIIAAVFAASAVKRFAKTSGAWNVLLALCVGAALAVVTALFLGLDALQGFAMVGWVAIGAVLLYMIVEKYRPRLTLPIIGIKLDLYALFNLVLEPDPPPPPEVPHG